MEQYRAAIARGENPTNPSLSKGGGKGQSNFGGGAPHPGKGGQKGLQKGSWQNSPPSKGVGKGQMAYFMNLITGGAANGSQTLPSNQWGYSRNGMYSLGPAKTISPTKVHNQFKDLAEDSDDDDDGSCGEEVSECVFDHENVTVAAIWKHFRI